MLDLSIIIVNYNTKEFLKRCINSIIENVKGVSYEIIIVDNASSDGSPSEISRLRQDFGGQANIKAILNKENVGFSKANNIGIKASDKNSKYVLFLNPDTVVQNQTIEQMLKFME